MSSTTENLGLTLPDVTDFYDVGVTNTNMSLIDAAVGQIADTGAKETSVQSIITKIGTTTDTGGTATTGTVMAKLNALQSGVVSQEYIGADTSGIPLISTPFTITINGAGKFYGMAAKLYPNHNNAATLNKLVTRIVTDNTTIMTNRCYYESASSGWTIAYIGVGTQDVYKFDFHSPNWDYSLLLHEITIPRNLGSANVFGEPTDTVITGGSSYPSRVSILTKPIKFNQSLTVSISSEDNDNLSRCYLYLVYLLD